MEKLDSAIVTLVLKMKEIVILMMSVKMVFYVDQTIVLLHLVLTLNLIVVTSQLFVSLILKSEIDQILGQLKLTIEQISGTKGDCLIPD